MKKILRLPTPESVKRQIPRIGIFVFAGSSTHALGEFFNGMANTPSRWYTVASWLVELYSAFVIGLAVEQLKIATASIGKGMPKEKRRMGRIMAGVYLAGASPTIAVSVIANALEFGGGWKGGLLGLLFPLLCICSAVADVLPDVMAAKTKGTQSGTKGATNNVEGNGSKPKQAKKELEQFIAKCHVAGCDWVGNEGKPYTTVRKRKNALNGHMGKHREKNNG